MRLSAPALSKRKLPSQSRRTRCSKPGHSGSGLTHPQHRVVSQDVLLVSRLSPFSRCATVARASTD